jgi:16S rRNA processing protein RimM
MAGWLRAGMVSRPHGLDGSVHVHKAVPALLTPGATVRVAGQQRQIVRRAGHDRRVIVRLEGCEDRESARALAGAELLVAREHAPELGDEEWWAEDLEGCAVYDGELVVGRVRRVLALPSCEALEVERSSGEAAQGSGRNADTGRRRNRPLRRAPLLVPLIADAVRHVDVQARRIEVDLEFLGERG